MKMILSLSAALGLVGCAGAAPPEATESHAPAAAGAPASGAPSAPAGLASPRDCRCTCMGATSYDIAEQCSDPQHPNNPPVTKHGRCWEKKDTCTGKPCAPLCDAKINICNNVPSPGCQ